MTKKVVTPIQGKAYVIYPHERLIIPRDVTRSIAYLTDCTYSLIFLFPCNSMYMGAV